MPKGCLLKVLKSKVVFITSYIKLIFVGYSTAIFKATVKLSAIFS